MPSLNHVSMWSASEHKWVPITAEEAAREFPFTVPASLGQLRCELCGHFVALTGPGANIRHFRHAAADENKECEERSIAYNRYYYNASEIINRAGLPIRIIVDVSRRSFQLEMGFHCVPSEILQTVASKRIEIKGSSKSAFVYSFDRLKHDTVTYLSIGSEPSEHYSLKVDKALKSFWPSEVSGIRNSGNIFDGQTGHLKRMDTDVVTEKDYYILSRRSYLYIPSSSSVRLDTICEKATETGRWYLYRVSAKEMSHEAYQFFLQFGCRLTEQPARLQPLWPITTRTSYSVKTNRDTMLFYLSGGYITCNAPDARKEVFSTQGGNKLVRVAPDKFPQLVSSGRTSIINYLYVWKDSLSKQQSLPQIEAKSGAGDDVQPGVLNILPEQKRLYFISPFDGMVIVQKNGTVIDRKTIKAGERLPVFDIAFGYEIQVTQGLDCVWSVTFRRATKISNSDDELYRALCSYNGNEVRITHKDGALAAKLDNCPKVKQWLYEKIRVGHAPYAAIKHLNKYVSEQQNR